jgi:hypothetical protein
MPRSSLRVEDCISQVSLLSTLDRGEARNTIRISSGSGRRILRIDITTRSGSIDRANEGQEMRERLNQDE